MRSIILSLAVAAGVTTGIISKLCVDLATVLSHHMKGIRLSDADVNLGDGHQAATQERHSMDIEDGNKSVIRIVDTTRAALHVHRDAGWDDEQFVLKLLGEFVGLRKQMSSDAGSLHMALSIYNLAIMADYIEELEEKVDFHKSAVEFLLELDEFESI